MFVIFITIRYSFLQSIVKLIQQINISQSRQTDIAFTVMFLIYSHHR